MTDFLTFCENFRINKCKFDTNLENTVYQLISLGYGVEDDFLPFPIRTATVQLSTARTTVLA
jgi:hypothetical protein